MLKKIIIIILLIWILGSLWWYLSPTSMLNTSYKTNLNLKEFKEPHLIVVSHNYEIVDAMIMCGESKYSHNNINIIAEYKTKDNGDKINQFWKNFPIYTSYRKLDFQREKKNNLVQKSIEYLEKGENVLIFLHQHSKSKGIYHILKEKKYPILFTKIYREDHDLKYKRDKTNYLKNIFGYKFKVDYNSVKDYETNKEPEKFMEWVKDNIYN